MQTATATVAGRRRVSFTLPEPAATTFIPRVDVESEGRRSTWPPTRTERYPEGLHVFCGAATTIFWACNSFQAVSARRRDARYGGGVYACLRRGRPRQTSVYGAPRLQNLPCETRFTTARGAPHESAVLENFRDSAVSSKVSTSRVTEFVEPRANGRRGRRLHRRTCFRAPT